MRLALSIAAIMSTSILFGCPDDTPPEEDLDAGTRMDAGKMDASGVQDAAPAMDAGAELDAEPGMDAVAAMDALPTTDGATPPARQAHTATMLDDGRVLVTGGLGDDDVPFETWIFDPANDAWTAGPPLPEARLGHTATLLGDGRVLIAGGTRRIPAPGMTLASALIFDPTQLSFTPTSTMAAPRTSHQAFLLSRGPDAGKVLIGGGGDISIRRLAFELFDPATGRFTPTGTSLPADHIDSSWVELADGRILISGGASAPGGSGILDRAMIYDPMDHSLVPVMGRMGVTRWEHAPVRLADGKVLIIGGSGEMRNELASCELFDPMTGQFTAAGDMSLALRLATAVRLASGAVMISGGTSANAIEDSIELYTPGTGFMTSTQTLPIPLAGHTATLLRDGRVLLVGGQTTRGFVAGTFALYTFP